MNEGEVAERAKRAKRAKLLVIIYQYKDFNVFVCLSGVMEVGVDLGRDGL